MSLPVLGLSRVAPPDEEACVDLGARSLLLLPALMLVLSLGALGLFHVLLLLNGLTTLQFTRRWRARGLRSLKDLLLRHGETETDKWAQLWGAPNASAARKLRVLLLPTLPHRRKASPGVGKGKAWLGAGATLAGLLLLLPLASSALVGAGERARAVMSDAAKDLANVRGAHAGRMRRTRASIAAAAIRSSCSA